MAVTPASAYADSRALRAASTSATHDALIDDLDRSLHELVERMLKSSGRRVDISRPFVETKDDYGISTTSRVAMSSIAQPIGQFGGPQVRRNSSAMLDSRNHQAA